MYKKILVPLDGSKRAERILPHVEELASRYKTKVILLMALDCTFSAGVEGSFIEFSEKEEDFNARYKEAESYLERISEKFHKKDINTQRMVAYGPAVERIIHVAEKENANLIAMTSHDRAEIELPVLIEIKSGTNLSDFKLSINSYFSQH